MSTCGSVFSCPTNQSLELYKPPFHVCIVYVPQLKAAFTMHWRRANQLNKWTTAIVHRVRYDQTVANGCTNAPYLHGFPRALHRRLRQTHLGVEARREQSRAFAKVSGVMMFYFRRAHNPSGHVCASARSFTGVGGVSHRGDQEALASQAV